MRYRAARSLIACGLAASLIVQPQGGAQAARTAITTAAVPGSVPLTAVQAWSLRQHATQRVIVVLRQGARSADGSAWAVAQAALLGELRQVAPAGVTPLTLIDAYAATISPQEAARLAADPQVLEVVPDRVIRLHRPQPQQAALTAATRTAAAPPNGTVTLTPSDPAPACLKSKTPSLEPEALQLTDTAFSNPSIPQAQRLRSGSGASITGAGVKVAWIADGIDIHNPDFVRPAGSPYGKPGLVFVDYRDFSGDGPTAPTSGGESFIDAGSIGAQGNKVYDLNNYLANPLPGACKIRILGMAPGAAMVGLKVFGQTYATTNSAFVQAIDYAVNVDHVDVINESFGGNPFPDLANDPIALANARAIAAGVTIVASSGDAGVEGTVGSPATSPDVIAVGATTQFREYSQVGGYAITLGNGGYISNNMSSLSSAGFSQSGQRIVDVVAPGDSSWAPCTASTDVPPPYADCRNIDRSAPANIEEAGGTSESSPLTAGEAALVIQAYRSTHHGASPSPAVVKQIIVSTATDLHIPAVEQGAGLIDSYRAVQAALSYRDAVATPAPRADALLLAGTTAFTATAAPGTAETFSVDVANIGARRQLLAPRLQRLGSPTFAATYTRYLDPLSDPYFFYDQAGSKRAYIEQDFPVKPGVQRLEATFAWLASQQPGSVVRLSLFDPKGRLAAFSLPQDAGAPFPTSGFGQVSVHDPKPGTWKAILWTKDSATSGSYHGAIKLSVTTSHFVPTGSVSPAAVIVGPGGHAIFTVRVHTPAAPGDMDNELTFPSPSGTRSLLGAIPIVLRSLVPISARGGGFSGLITGGNGRQGAPGQTLSYAFDVPSGLHDLELGLQVADPNNNLQGVLVDPTGQPIDVQTMAGAVDANGLPNYYTGTMQFFRRDPIPGRWLFVLLVNDNVSGAATAQPFQVRIGFNGVRYKTKGLPQSAGTFMPAGKPVNAAILVANTGLTTKDFFLDPRLDTTAIVPLNAPDAYSVTLPITASQQLPPFLVPPAVSELDITGTSPTPFAFDAYTVLGAAPFGGTGSPDLYQSSGPELTGSTGLYTATVTVQAPEVVPGPWFAGSPEQFGPFPSRGATPSSVDIRAVAYGQPFDRAVASSTGDIWSPFAAVYRPLVLAPGDAGAIRVRITPHGAPGTTVHGFLYVETFNSVSSSGDELVAIPYSYTIGSKGK